MNAFKQWWRTLTEKDEVRPGSGLLPLLGLCAGTVLVLALVCINRSAGEKGLTFFGERYHRHIEELPEDWGSKTRLPDDDPEEHTDPEPPELEPHLEEVADGVYVYILADGSRYEGVLRLEDGLWLFGEEGESVSGWQNDMYCVNGRASTGLTNIDGTDYLFDGEGQLVRSGQLGAYGTDADGRVIDYLREVNADNLDAYLEKLLDEIGRDPWSIFLYVQSSFTYRYSGPDTEDALILGLLSTGYGSCYAFSSICCRLLRMIGCEAMPIYGKGTYYDEHGWTLYRVPGGAWRHMDPIWHAVTVYNATDADLIDYSSRENLNCTYEWDRSQYPAAN